MQTQKLIGVYANPIYAYRDPTIEDTLLLVYYLFNDGRTLVEASHIIDVEKPKMCVIKSKVDWKLWHNHWDLRQYYIFQELDPYLLLTERSPYSNIAKIYLRENFESYCLTNFTTFKLFAYAWDDLETPRFSRKYGSVNATSQASSPLFYGDLSSIRFSPHEYIKLSPE